jgi:hypothetical protein
MRKLVPHTEYVKLFGTRARVDIGPKRCKLMEKWNCTIHLIARKR